jgi:hypothetical protein
MNTGTQLPEQMPPTRRRPQGAWVAVAAAVAVVLTAGGVLLAIGPDRPQPATGAGPTATAPVPTATAPVPTASAITVLPDTEGTSGSQAPLPVATAQWLWPFADPADAARWQQDYRQGGHQPWHLDAAATALGFAGYLGYGDVDKVVRSTVDGREAYVAVGTALPNGSLHTAAVVHLVRMGTGADAPWEVVGTRDTTLTLDRPGYGSTVASPMTVGGRITGVDEQVVVTLHALSGGVQAERAAVPAGGVRAPWSVPVRFSGGAGRTVTVAAATGGHVAAVERFAVTGVRIGATG